MATSRIIRKNFNGGEIAPELHFRSDLETYHNSCKSLKNMLVTPWGAVTRRPPTELLAQIDTDVYGVPVKYLPFRFSLSEVFHIIFTDGSGSAGTDATTADIIVFDAGGALQTLDGASTKILDTVYDPGDLLALHHIQVNDFIYMTCGGDYPVQTLNRFFDDAQAANRWRIDEWNLFGGPFAEENLNVDYSITAVTSSFYSGSTTYAKGDVVLELQLAQTIIAAEWVLAGSIQASTGHGQTAWFNQYQLEITTIGSMAPIEAGDLIWIIGMTGSGGTTSARTGEFHTESDTNGDLFGMYRVEERKSATNFVLSKTIYNYKGAETDAETETNPTLSIDSAVAIDSKKTEFHTSLQDGNTGNDLTSENFWRSDGVYTKELLLYTPVPFLDSSYEGKIMKMVIDQKDDLKGFWTSNQESKPVNGQGTVELITEGSAWSGLLELRASYDAGANWGTIGFIRSDNGASNGSIEREISNPNAILKVVLTNWSFPTGNYETEGCSWRLIFKNDVFQLFEITDVISGTNATARPITPITGVYATHRWALEQFTDEDGYPNTLSIHDERMVFGGTKRKPNTVWASRVNDWNNFLEGDTEVSPYTFTIKSDSFDSIRWMRSARQLMIGTDNSESTMGTRDTSQVISPTNIDVRTHTYFGSANLQAVVTADLVFFVQGQAERVRSSQYDFGTDQYLSSEMSILAHHITKPGIKEMSFRRHPYSNIFCVKNDGTAVSFTYERENRVKGWSRIEIGGATIVSAAANYSEAGDIVAGVVKRGSEYFLEFFGNTDADTVYLDGQKQFEGEDYSAGVAVPWADATGLTVVRDDVELDPTEFTMSGGTLTIPGATDGTVTVGYKFAWNVEPTDLIALGDFGAFKRISALSLYLLQSGGCEVAINGVESPFQAALQLSPAERLHGEYSLSVDGGSESSISIRLSGDGHRPFNLSALGIHGGAS